MVCMAPGGCHIGFHSDSILPTASHDACDTAGIGQYLCVGSYFLYDGTGDPLLGQCERLFVNTSDVCLMANWIEISIPSVLESDVDPVNGVDCCPPGSLFHNTVTDAYFLSLNINGSCLWCEICAGDVELPHTSHFEQIDALRTEYDNFDGGIDDIPGADTANINVQNVLFTNPSAVRSMVVCVSWSGTNGGFSFNSDSNWSARYAIQTEVRTNLNAGGWIVENDRFRWDAFMSRTNEPPGIFEQDYATGGWHKCFTVGPGGTLEVEQIVYLNVLLPTTANLASRLQIESGPITIMGTTI